MKRSPAERFWSSRRKFLLTMVCCLVVLIARQVAADGAPTVTTIEPGKGRVFLVLSPHADDATLFIGGTVAAWSDAGWRVVVVRVTDDRWDSFELPEADTITRSAAELREAMTILGVKDVIDLGLPTDVLGDADRLKIRERIIWLIRTWKPYAVATIDPYSGVHEDNQDHIVVAEATAEAVWTAQFDKHHPEHLAAGLAPHGVVESWSFGRPVREVTDAVDVSRTLQRKLQATLVHRTPLRNIVHQLRLQARTAGYRLQSLEDAQRGDFSQLVENFIGVPARAKGERYGVTAVEEFRVVRFDLLQTLKAHGEPL